MQYTLPETHDHLDERQFLLAVRRLADSLSYGSDASPFLGAGIEYVQSRPYVPGDAVRSIDWRITARTGKYYVKEYEAPKRMPVFILLDTSASMCVSSQQMSKYTWGVQLAAALALAAQMRLSPAGLLGCGEREIYVQPTLSRSVVLQWAHKLRRHRMDEQTRVGAKLRELAPQLENRSLVILISDLHDPDAIPALKLMAQEHDTAALQLIDPAELGRIGGGIFRAREAESDATFVAHGRSRWFDPEAEGHALNRGGVDHLTLRIDEPFVPHLRQWLARRHLFGRGAR
ncbi:DUF58 domain-containing protein [Candidatus Sumerlaeota bacterium]|nr:DUF58 domain-containing protein [Candidatus Sumerlaeota bacterium]